MSPTTATGTAKPAPLTITVALTNTTGQALRDVQLSAQREAPISRQSQLDQLMAHPTAGDPNGVQPMHGVDLGNLAAHASARVIYRATTSTVVSAADICLCLTGVYTIDFNKEYNPYCFYNPDYDCPYPPRESRLPLPIRAGERLP